MARMDRMMSGGPDPLPSEAEVSDALREADLLLRQGDALSKLGRVRDAVLAYGRVARLAAVLPALVAAPLLPSDCLRGLAAAVLDECAAPHLSADNRPAKETSAPGPCSLVCPACEGVLQSPVTLACGHTACRRCLASGCGRLSCPRCGYRPAPGTPLVTNVLVQRLVERWWPQELRAARLGDQGNALFHDGNLHDAIIKYGEAIQLTPSSPLLRSNRSHALSCIGKHQEALQDADEVVRLRPTWGKGYYRRGTALMGLFRFEEALSAFCACAVLGRNPQAVRAEVTRALHRLLTARPPPPPPALGRQPRSLAWRVPPPCTSDCEDNSSDEGEAEGRHREVSCPSPSAGDLRLLAVLDRLAQDMEKLRRMGGATPNEDLAVNPGQVDQTELDCVLCCRTLWKPVTTPCGHTYCCMCLDRCLDHSYSCPLCMTSLTEYLTTSPRNVTEWLETALQRAVPRELALRQASHALELSEQGPACPCPCPAPSPCVPVFVCTTAFPGVPCPLYVYEPRYRLLVRRCIESGARTFGMAAPACVYLGAGSSGNGLQDRFVEFGTLLEICDLVRLCDGSSILSTVGRRRFRVLQRGERDGYDVASVQLYSDKPTPAERLPGVRELHDRVRMKSELWLSSMDAEPYAEIERSFGAMPAVEPGWERCPDGPMWAWYLLAVLPLGPQLQVGILSTTSLEKRLRAIDKTLDHLAHRIRAQRQSQQCSSPS